MTKQISEHAAAAKAIRQELKKHGIKATVKASSYSMGSSVNVRLLNDELPATVAKIEEFANQYQEGHFDGMTDMYEYSNRNSDLPQVKFVFVEMRYSDEITAAALEFVTNRFGSDLDEYRLREHANRELRSNEAGGFWSTRKPRVAA